MKNYVNAKSVYWFLIILLFFLPITNSFYINIKNTIKLMFANNEYKTMFNKLYVDNKSMSKKLRYYKTSQGLKALIKDRLNKVDDGESIIKFDVQEMQ